MKYDAVLIDTMNVFYRTAIHKTELSNFVSKKRVYKESICRFIRKINEVVSEYSYHDADIYLLFDNPTSRIELRSAFMFAGRKDIYPDYKENRVKESKEFYNSLGLIKYYYLIKEPNYRCLQANRLEADDLVKPLIENELKNKSVLLVSNDLDWAKEVKENIHWLKNWDEVVDERALSDSLDFKATESSLIVYKSLFGDSSDNIPSLVKASMFPQFKEFAPSIKDPLDVIDWSNNDEKRKQYPLLKKVAEFNRQYRINVQLVSSIPVSPTHLKNITARGRDSPDMRIIVEKAIGLRTSQKSFEFGGVNRERV